MTCGPFAEGHAPGCRDAGFQSRSGTRAIDRMHSNLSQMHLGCALVKIKRKIRGSSWPGSQHGRHTGIVFPHSIMKITSSFVSVGAALLCACSSSALPRAAAAAEGTSPLRVLFLGDTGHHRPADRFKQLEP